MLWPTHNRITIAVMDRLGMRLTNEEFSKLMEGIVAPDKYFKDYPHHYGKSAQISQYLLMARSFFLQNDSPNAYYNLGVALHYIQDSFTTGPNFDSDFHTKWEGWIEDSSVVSNVDEKIQETVRNKSEQNRCSQVARELQKEVQGRDDTLRIAMMNGHMKNYETMASPEVDLNLGLIASYVVSKSILGPKYCPDLDIQLRNILVAHENYLNKSDIDSSNNIMGLIRKREEIAKGMVPPSGIVAKIKYWLTSRRIRIIERDIISKTNRYYQKEHLENVARSYRTEVSRATAPYDGWYIFQIPQLNIDAVPLELLRIQAISETFGWKQQNLKNLFRDKNIPIHQVGNNEIVRRADLDRLLGQIPINGLTRYPELT
jgi:hypothetical protein